MKLQLRIGGWRKEILAQERRERERERHRQQEAADKEPPSRQGRYQHTPIEGPRRLETPLEDLVRMLERKPPARVPGTAVFLTSDPKSAPTALMHSLKHYKVLHEKNVIISVETTHTPRVESAKRVEIEQVGSTFMRIRLRFGYMETPNIPRALAIARKLGWQFDIMSTSFFLSRRALRPAPHSGMPRWQDRLFIWLARSANDATDYFQIPTDRVVEVGTQVTV
jgi:KUP system potassium uptake protein